MSVGDVLAVAIHNLTEKGDLFHALLCQRADFGDDVTDEAGFEAVQALGGVAVKVGDGDTVARWRLPDPAAVHAWLETQAVEARA